jgi:hypothetical protein
MTPIKFLLFFFVLTFIGCVDSTRIGTIHRFFENKKTRYLNVECHYKCINNTFYLSSLGNTSYHSITCRKLKETNEFSSFTPMNELRMYFSKKRKSQDLHQLNVYLVGKTLASDERLFFEYNDARYGLNDFPIREANKRDSLSFEVGFMDKKTPLTFSYLDFDYSDLDVNTEVTTDSVVMDKQKDEIRFFLKGKEISMINKWKNWTFE